MEYRTGNIGMIFIDVWHGEGVLAERTRLTGSEQIKQAVFEHAQQVVVNQRRTAKGSIESVQSTLICG